MEFGTCGLASVTAAQAFVYLTIPSAMMGVQLAQHSIHLGAASRELIVHGIPSHLVNCIAYQQ